jgi:hypothetical protein
MVQLLPKPVFAFLTIAFAMFLNEPKGTIARIMSAGTVALIEVR